MSRHTLNDGVTPDREIRASSYELWWPELAPPSKLIGAYYKRGLPWESFEAEFNAYLHESQVARIALARLIEFARHMRLVAILCVEPSPEHCHRRLVAEACRRIDPSLVTVIE